MPPSQLKRLKSSLREQGILGPQQSKKQKRQNAQNGANKDKRVDRKLALKGIREQFNPFEFMLPARKPKWDVTALEGNGENVAEATFIEFNNKRNKVGGIVDKRFGENDPTIAPELKMLERYTRAQQKGGKPSAFDLEDDEPSELTHMGKSLSLDAPNIRDDFDEDDLESSDADDQERHARKRRRSELEEEGAEGQAEDGEERPERKKSKQEVMHELIAKSKFHKHERQALKDDDHDLIDELDAELPNIRAMIFGTSQNPPSSSAQHMNPDRAALLSGNDKAKIEKTYDINVRKLAQDERSKPTEKSKPEEQVIEERARKLQELEAKRLRRMQGSPNSSDDEDAEGVLGHEEEGDTVGLGRGIKTQRDNLTMASMGFDDEDDFIIDDSFLDTRSEISESDVRPSDGEEQAAEVEDDDFTLGLLTSEEASRPEFLTGANAPPEEVEFPTKNGVNGDLPFNYDCPSSHQELLNVTKKIAIQDLPEVIKRIRTQYNVALKNTNKEKLRTFTVALVDHISYLANQEQRPPFAILETVIRHIHSMAKDFPVAIANAFRQHLDDISKTRSRALTPGDLVILTAIGSVFSSSDHFHPVITPAILVMCRYLGLKIPQTISDYATGAYLCTLCLQYQKLSKRYVPEVLNFIENTLCVLAPMILPNPPGNFPFHKPKTSMRIRKPHTSTRKLKFYDCVDESRSEAEEAEIKIAIMEADLKLLSFAADLWADKPSFTEIFIPVSEIAKHLGSKECRSMIPESTKVILSTVSEKINFQLRSSHLKRRPLELHHHKPLAIKTSIPKFEESFNPNKSYDQDPKRLEGMKLRQEHKKMTRNVVRELKKDARKITTQKHKEDRERDEAYKKKYKRLVAEIQGEEGKEKNAYDREREWRKKGRK